MALIPPPWEPQPAPAPAPREPEHWKWKPGQSGNPSGRSKGTKNKRTLVAEVLEQGVEDVARAMLAEAKNGDVAAAKLVLERIVPPLRNEGPRIVFDLDAERPLAEQGQQVLVAVSTGQMDPATGRLLIECLASLGGLREHDQFGARLAQLEREVRASNQTDGALGAVLQTGSPS